MRSRKASPRLRYRLAIETTRRRLASINASLACSPSRTSRRSRNRSSGDSSCSSGRPSASARPWAARRAGRLVALLDPPGHLDLELGAQQRDLADLLQVGVDRILGAATEVVRPRRALRGLPARPGSATRPSVRGSPLGPADRPAPSVRTACRRRRRAGARPRRPRPCPRRHRLVDSPAPRPSSATISSATTSSTATSSAASISISISTWTWTIDVVGGQAVGHHLVGRQRIGLDVDAVVDLDDERAHAFGGTVGGGGPAGTAMRAVAPTSGETALSVVRIPSSGTRPFMALLPSPEEPR